MFVPRYLNTVDAVNQLRPGTIFLDALGEAYEFEEPDGYRMFAMVDYYSGKEITLPVRVLIDGDLR